MTIFDENHPCRGKVCKDCETCIFDEDLFVEKPIKINNMCNDKLCNNCVNLEKSYENIVTKQYDIACRAVSYEAFGHIRPRRIANNISDRDEVKRPNWCPLKNGNTQQKLVATAPNMQQKQVTTPAYTSYADRREKLKELRPHIAWEDLKEGNYYIIPKILSKARKVVKVITKTDLCCICHEISEYTGNEYTYNTTIYPSDLECVFINEIRNF